MSKLLPYKICILSIGIAIILAACDSPDNSIVAELPMAEPIGVESLITVLAPSTPTVAKPTLAITSGPTFNSSTAVAQMPAQISTRVKSITKTPPDAPEVTANQASCNKLGKVVRGQYPSQIAGPTRTYSIYLPPCYDDNARMYPALYLFHGNIHDDMFWDGLGIDEAADALIRDGRIPPLLIVMPNGGSIANSTSGGNASFEGIVLEELLPFIEEKYCASNNAEGRAIGGISRGGYWALEIAYRHPELFASVGGHSAALNDIAAGPDIDPLNTGIENDLHNLRIYLDIGKSDYLKDMVITLHERLGEVGVDHTWRLNDGEHSEQYWRNNLMEYLEWYTFPWRHFQNSQLPC